MSGGRLWLGLKRGEGGGERENKEREGKQKNEGGEINFGGK